MLPPYMFGFWVDIFVQLTKNKITPQTVDVDSSSDCGDQYSDFGLVDILEEAFSTSHSSDTCWWDWSPSLDHPLSQNHSLLSNG